MSSEGNGSRSGVAPSPTARRNLSRLADYLRLDRSRLRRASLYSVTNKLFDIAPEILIGFAVDVVVKRENSFLGQVGISSLVVQLIILAVLTIVTWGGESWFQYLYQLRWRSLAQDVQARVRADAYDHVQRLPMVSLTEARTGELQTILTEDVNQLERFLNSGINDILQLITSTVAVIGVFFLVAPQLAVLSMVPIPVIVGIAFYFQRGLAERYQSVRKEGGRLGAQLTAQLQGIPTLRAYTAESQALSALKEESQRYVDANARAIALSSAFVPLVRMAILLGFVATLVAGGMMSFEGQLSVGAFSVLVFLTQRLLWPFTRLGETVDMYQRSMASAGRLFDLLELEAEAGEGETFLPDAEGVSLCFHGVWLRYPGASKSALHAVDLDIPPRQFIGLVGTTGSGKSSLMRLLLRFYDPSEGWVELGQRNMAELSKSSVRKAIGWVSQDIFLFHGSIRDNIELGHPGASSQAIEAAAKAAEIHDFIMGLPHGYESQVGEFGAKLSGGERQRLAIARALLKDPPILIFDEATSAVDNETEAAIQRSILRAAEGRTVLAVAHRLSTIQQADQIVVLESGRIVEKGTHRELLAAEGSYARLHQASEGTA